MSCAAPPLCANLSNARRLLLACRFFRAPLKISRLMSAVIKQNSVKKLWKPLFIGAASAFLYAPVLIKLGQTWWTDENYSHGLLMPFLTAYIVWRKLPEIVSNNSKSSFYAGLAIILTALMLLLGGTLGAELFTQRFSLVVMLGGIALYFFGADGLRKTAFALLLLALAIPIPSILFNKIAFPLQIYASQAAVGVVRLLSIPIVRQGNVIEILPQGAAQTVQFEVVEACSGIRSLMTLVTLAFVYAYFTRRQNSKENVGSADVLRGSFLALAAIPIAVITNALRVAATVVTAHFYGSETAESFLHGVSGWLVYLLALVFLQLAAATYDFLSNTARKRLAQTI